MKKLIILFVLVSLLLACCGGRDLSTPSNRLVGHWKAQTSSGAEYYISAADPNTKEGIITEFDPSDGAAFVGKYTISSESPDGEKITMDVTWPGLGMLDIIDYVVNKDGMSATMRKFTIEYVDENITPPLPDNDVLLETMVSETIAAMQIDQQKPTSESTAMAVPPTSTPLPKSTPGESIEDQRVRLYADLESVFLDYSDTEVINMIRVNDGALEIEVKSIYSSQDRMPDLAYHIAKQVAGIFALPGTKVERLKELWGGDNNVLILTVYSAAGDYPHTTVTDYETLQKIATKQITFEEWKIAAGANY